MNRSGDVIFPRYAGTQRIARGPQDVYRLLRGLACPRIHPAGERELGRFLCGLSSGLVLKYRESFCARIANPMQRTDDADAREGQEDQLGVMGLVVAAITLWNTRYLNAAITELRPQGGADPR